MDKNKIIKHDRMKYKSNGLSSMLCILGVVFNMFYFIVLYSVHHKVFFTTLMMASVVYNLLFMLFVFLSSIKVKAYDNTFAIVAIVLGAIQIARIFIWPLTGIRTPISVTNDNSVVTNSEFIRMTVYLCTSCACLIAGGVIGILRTEIRSAHIKAVDSGEIDISFISTQVEEDA